LHLRLFLLVVSLGRQGHATAWPQPFGSAIHRIHPPLNLTVTHLPRIEHAARESIDKETSKQILNSQGVNLEFNMVSSQLAAMNYAAHLARSLAVVETNPRRKEFLLRTDRNFSELHAQVYKMLLTRYQR
jgi:hypothetical protein